MSSSAFSGGDAAVPTSVRQLARQRRLGDLLGVRRERSTGSMVGGGLAVFAIGLLLTLVIGAYNSAQDAATYSGAGGTTHHLLAPTGAITLIGLGFAIRGLIVGTRAHYLYSEGLVHGRRSGPRAVDWPEVRELRAVYGRDAGSVVGYRIVADSDRPIVIPLRLVDGRDAFADQLLEVTGRHHLPVH